MDEDDYYMVLWDFEDTDPLTHLVVMVQFKRICVQDSCRQMNFILGKNTVLVLVCDTDKFWHNVLFDKVP